MRTVVVDTNCLLRMIPLRSKYRQAWDAFLNGRYVICVSNEIMSEYMEILSRKVSESFAENIVNAIIRNYNVRRVEPSFKFGLITTDPDDNKFVDCAIVANADYIVSDDRHFNEPKNIPFPKVNVQTLDRFIIDLTKNRQMTTNRHRK